MLTYEPNKRLSALDCMNQSWFIKNKGKNTSDKKMAKNVLGNMKKFKRDRKLEQATIGFIVNQLITRNEIDYDPIKTIKSFNLEEINKYLSKLDLSNTTMCVVRKDK